MNSYERQQRDLLAFAKRGGHKIVGVFTETDSRADDGIAVGIRQMREKVLRRSQTPSTGLSSDE